MADITLGAGRQEFLLERTGESDTIRDFRSLYFDSTLDEAQEVPPNDDIAGIEGTGTGVLNFARTRFEFALEIEGIDLDGGAGPDDLIDAHIHGAPEDETGPVIFDFLNDAETDVDGSAGTITGGWDEEEEEDASDLTPENLTDLLAGDTYFNIHTNRDPSGFIRGQILRDGGAGDRIDLSALNIGTLDALKAVTLNRGGDAVIRTFLDGERTFVRLDGVSKADLRDDFFIFAGREAETILGTAERDDLFGAGGSDDMRGRAGDDRLFGENGADAVAGGAGSDSIWGGRGRDEMTGGQGADRFFFLDAEETGDTRRSADLITDFNEAVDLLVFRAIDAREGRPGRQDFEFIGDADFDRAGQIRVTEARGDTFVELNTRGRSDAEAMIRLEGSVPLTDDSLLI